MNFLDGIILIAVLMGAFWGFRNGFIKALLSFVALGVAVWAGFKFSGVLEDQIKQLNLFFDEWIPLVSIIVALALVFIGIRLVGIMATQAVKMLGLGLFNRLGGALFGILINVVILAAAMSYLLPYFGNELLGESRFLPLLNQVSNALGANMDFLNDSINNINWMY